MLFLSLFIGILFATHCYQRAKERGRNPIAWSIAGMFFPIFALLFLYLLPPRSSTMPQRTRPPEPTIYPKEDAQVHKFWYYLNEENAQFGPMSFDAIKRAWKAGKVTSCTLVWNEDFSEWKRLEAVVEQTNALTNSP